MQWMLDTFEIAADDRVLQKTAFGFDGSVYEFYAPLLAGACLVLARPGGQRDADYLLRCMVEHGITTIQFVPSQLQMLVETEGLGKCRDLRRVFCGGEALSMDLAQRARSLMPWAKLYNMYGPTEVTIEATFGECGTQVGTTTAPIGKPIANMRSYVLDEEMHLVPTSSWGELYLGGTGLARGYSNQPALTAERFLPDPFGRCGERLYRTGDVVRWQADGTLEFRGRIDAQVKIRGYRIELGEIEAVLRRHDSVDQSVVLARAHGDSDQRLVAYYTAKPNQTMIEPETLRVHMARILAEYMVPAAYVRLESFPLMPNGKVDRNALPAPGAEAYALAGYEPPAGETENFLAGIWADALKVERVGRYDNFFALGGHSLLAGRVITRIRQLFGVELTISDIFARPILSSLAERIVDLQLQQFDPADIEQLLIQTQIQS
jgi:acyl-coenzyme A synthetase/AMP-(fatty) acid ligase